MRGKMSLQTVFSPSIAKGDVTVERFVIQGGGRLVGEVPISGAKNAAVAILTATVLAEKPCIIENVPNIRDVSIILKILTDIGAVVQTIDRSTVMIDTKHVQKAEVPYEMARLYRASYYFLGVLLGRFGRASVAMPGGCDLGVRPIDLHIKACEALGAKVSLEQGGMVDVKADNLIGTHIYMDGYSVGATINAILAAVKANGLTVIENAGKEPHIVDLANFLNSMGADIRGAGTDVIKIRGVSHLGGATYSIIPDQIETGTFMVAAAATRGNVLIKNVIPKHLECITAKLRKIGAVVEEFDDSIKVVRTGGLLKDNIKTMPHPGFPTDMQAQITVLLALAQGTSIITESIFDNRFRYVEHLRHMGAHIQVDGNIAIVEGGHPLKGAPVIATDLRAGAALIIAGLCAQGTTYIEDIYHIERGYEDMESKLCGLGADIKKIYTPDPLGMSQAL